MINPSSKYDTTRSSIDDARAADMLFDKLMEDKVDPKEESL